jgi:TonB family protein
MRLAAAIAASAALHAGAAYVAEVVPRGSLFGTDPLLAQPLQLHLRVLGTDPVVVVPPVNAAPQAGARMPPPERAAVAPAAPLAGALFGMHEGALYYPPSQLDVRPRLLTRVDPAYPQGAPPEGGHAVLRLLIGEDGKVERAIVVASDPVDKFGAAAAAAFGGAQFSSGKRNGVAVKSQLLIEMTFSSLVPPGVASAADSTQ